MSTTQKKPKKPKKKKEKKYCFICRQHVYGPYSKAHRASEWHQRMLPYILPVEPKDDDDYFDETVM